ncbi:transcription elongation factor GreA [Clostridium tarantellae]|uniref:Transcription elongation factor GreA n=1 Tax=Clostridium tarantellae TaxID=39493 RepID=A0A6I1MG47_9CLOT|nr:transcription elongation factor GreA [Clostridium tarantellae]MPQ42506.1 transcription elongation factor GreA [Clostridium tarantellae]
MKDTIKLTKESYNKLKDELKYLSSTVRVEIAKNLKVAADYGDLRENAEFEAERDKQAVVEARIREIKNTLDKCEIIEVDLNSKEVSIGKKVLVYNESFEEEEEFLIVDSVQANPLEGKISHHSPVGEKLLNKKIGDIIEVIVGDSQIVYKILDIN